MGSAPCRRCDKCGSDLAESPDTHIEPRPHLMVPGTVHTDAGEATLTRCRWCLRTRAELEAAGEPMEEFAAPTSGATPRGEE